MTLMVRSRRSTDEQRLLYKSNTERTERFNETCRIDGRETVFGSKGGLRLTGTKRGSGSTVHMGVERHECFLSTKNNPIRPVRPLFLLAIVHSKL